MTSYLSLEEVIFLHDELVLKYGGVLGVRDEKLLESAVYRCQASFGGKGLYKNIFEKAAALFHGIIFDHPFVDGNKRTAIMGAGSLLRRNGYKFDASDTELVAFPLFVEKVRPGISQIAQWFREHCMKGNSENKNP